MKKNLKVVNGTTWSFLDSTNPKKKTLFFIHGNSGDSLQFQNQTNFFQNEYRVIVPDLPGHGDSAKLERYTIKEMANHLAGFIDSFHIDEYLLAGHSLGGHLILQALENLNPLSILLWGTPAFSRPPEMEKCFLPSQNGNCLFTPEVDERSLMNFYLEAFPCDSMKSWELFRHSWAKADPLFRAQTGADLMGLNFKDEIKALLEYQGKVLFIHGRNDAFINARYFEETLGEFNLKYIEKSGHYTHLETPELFNETVENFLIDRPLAEPSFGEHPFGSPVT